MDEAIKIKKATYHLNTFLVSKMVGALGTNVYSFAISMYILSITGSSLTFATNLLLSILPRTLISPIVGVLGDRLPRKWLVLGGQLGQTIVILILLLYTILFDLSIIAIYVATVFNSLFNAFSSIAFTASISNLVNRERIQKAMSYNQMSVAISGIAGPVVGGILYGFSSITTFLFIYLVSLVITFSLEATMNFELYKTKITKIQEKKSMLTDFKEGIIYLKQQNIIKSVMFTILWINLFFCSVNVGGSFVFITILKMSPKNIGLIEAGLALGMLVATIIFASKLKVAYPLLFAKRAILSMGFVVMLMSLPLIVTIGNVNNFIYFTIMMFIFGFLVVSINTPLSVLLQTYIEENFRARIIGILETMSMSMMPLGTLVYGVLFDKIPAQYLFLGSGGLVMLTVLRLIRRHIIELAHPELKKDIKNKQNQKISKHEIEEMNETYYVKKVRTMQRTNFRYFR